MLGLAASADNPVDQHKLLFVRYANIFVVSVTFA